MDNLKKNSCTAKTAQGKPARGAMEKKKRTSAFHFPGPVFDVLKRFLQSYCPQKIIYSLKVKKKK